MDTINLPQLLTEIYGSPWILQQFLFDPTKKRPFLENLLNKVLNLPHSSENLVVAGFISFYMKQNHDSAVFFDEVLLDDPKNEMALLGLGYVLDVQNKLELAEQTFQQVISMNSSNLGALVGLASILIRHKKYDEGLRTLQDVLSKSPKHLPAQLELASLYFQQHNMDDAIRLLQNIIDPKLGDPNYIPAWINLGSFLESQGKFKEAEKALEHAFALKPEDKILQKRLFGLKQKVK